MSEVPAEVRLFASAAAHKGWAECEDRTARTRPGREALEAKFVREAGGDPVRAASLRKAYYKRLAAKSVASRRAKAAARNGGGNRG